MIVGVGSQREIDPYTPLLAVAGERARVQIEQLQLTRDSIISKLGITDEKFDNFIKNWAEPLAMIEDPELQERRAAAKLEGRNAYICNCRANDADRNFLDKFAVMNLIDILDIIHNVGYTEFFFDGASAESYGWQGESEIIVCSSCLGHFTGIVFNEQWEGDANYGERINTPIVELVIEGLPFCPLTQSWAYSSWKGEAKLYNSLGWDDNLFSHMIKELSNNSFALDSDFGKNWKPDAVNWSEDATKRRFDLWVETGADELHAAMGVLLERISYQHSNIPAPTTEMVEVLLDVDMRDRLVQHLNWYIDEVKKRPLVGLEKHVTFNQHVQMSKYDIDPTFLDLIK